MMQRPEQTEHKETVVSAPALSNAVPVRPPLTSVAPTQHDSDNANLPMPTVDRKWKMQADSTNPYGPQVNQGWYDNMQQGIDQFRERIRSYMPDTLLNHSTKAILGVHLLAEERMLRASGFPIFRKPSQGWGKSWDIVNTRFLKDFLNPEVKNRYGHFTNTWRAYGTALGTVAATASMLLPQRPQSQEDELAMGELAHSSPFAYVGMRMGQAFQPTDHARQTFGASMMVIGATAMIGGWTNTHIRTGQPYRLMKEVIGGAATVAAGGSLALTVQDNQAWKRYGALMGLGAPLRIGAAYDTWRKTGDRSNLVAQGYFQAMNALSFVIGGSAQTPTREVETMPHQPKNLTPQQSPSQIAAMPAVSERLMNDQRLAIHT